MNLKWMGLSLVVSLSALGQGVTNFDVCANADKVNLRARPETGTEVVAQAHEGQVLTVVRMEGDWMGVLAPSNAQVWVKSQFVKSGMISGGKIKLRSGPGISFRDVGALKQDTPVVEREVHGEWVRIDAPAELILWVNKSLTGPVMAAATNNDMAAVASNPAPAVAVASEVSTNLSLPRELPAGLSGDVLAPVLGQGRLVERSGTVERVPLAFLRGVDYRLVELRDGVKVTVCYLEGNDSQMPSLVDRRLTVKGREYWLKNQRHAVIYPELITPVVE